MSELDRPLLDIRALSVEYWRHGKTHSVLNQFSMTINHGETVGLIGNSGSGKSTVALAIMRLIRPQEGRITQGNVFFTLNRPDLFNLASLEPKDLVITPGGEPLPRGSIDLLTLPESHMRQLRGHAIAMIFQDPFTSLNPVMTIREQLTEALRDEWDTPISKTKRIAHGERIENALSQVQLDPARVLRSYPHQLSGGQRQRICIAMALLNRPQLLIADEPTTALDVIVQKEILDLIFALQKELGLSVLLITHNLALVAQYPVRQLFMEKAP